MTDATFDEVVRLAEQLSVEEQRALIDYLQQRTGGQTSFAEWKALFESAVIHTPVQGDFPLDRESWYDDNR